MKAKYPSWEKDYQRAWRKKRMTPERRAMLAAQKKEQYANDPKFRANHKAKNAENYRKNPAPAIARAARWAKENAERKEASRRKRYKERNEHFRAKGRQYSATRRATGKAALSLWGWRRRNQEKAAEASRRHHRKGIRNLADWYMCFILKRSFGVINPSKKQIEHRRAVIIAKRASRQVSLIQTTQKLCKALR